MLKEFKRINIILILYILFFVKVEADFVYCNNLEIDYGANNIIDLCKWWEIISDYNYINSWSWNTFDFKVGYIWNKLILNKFIDEQKNIPIWYFDQNHQTIISKYDFNYNGEIWFLWPNFDFENKFNSNIQIPVWFFSWNLETKIQSNKPISTSILWFILEWYYFDTENNLWDLQVPIYKDVTYREFFEFVFYEIWKKEYQELWYSKQEYDIFISNILSVLMDWETKSNQKISDNEQNKINLYIQNSNFEMNFSKLINNLREINLYFSTHNEKLSRIYMLWHILWK